jgi:RNA polymerase sigma-70 factor (ECF subfamily)
MMTARTRFIEGVSEFQAALADDDAFEAWYRRTLPRVYAYLLSRCGNDVGLAEDLSQQTFIAAIAQRGRYDGRSDVVTWLCGIARHKLADHFRTIEREERRRMHLVVRQIQLEDEAVAQPGLDDRAALADALRSLPAAHRAVLAFVVLDGLSVAEAGRLLGRSAAATQSLLHRARESFRRAYGEELSDD